MNFAKLLSATALVTALALPAMAETSAVTTGTTADSSTGISLDDTVNAALDGSLGAAVTADSTMPAVTADAAAIEEAATTITGKSVMSADDKVIGSVETAEADANGNLMLVIDVADEVKTEVGKFSIVVSADVATKGDLKLKWTEAELASSLDAKAAASNG